MQDRVLILVGVGPSEVHHIDYRFLNSVKALAHQSITKLLAPKSILEPNGSIFLLGRQLGAIVQGLPDQKCCGCRRLRANHNCGKPIQEIFVAHEDRQLLAFLPPGQFQVLAQFCSIAPEELCSFPMFFLGANGLQAIIEASAQDH